MEPNVLLISLDGFMGYYAMGYLTRDLKIDKYITTSIGSVLVLLLLLDIDPRIIIETIDFSDSESVHFVNPITKMQRSLHDFVERIVIDAFGAIPSMSDFYLHTKKEVYFGVYDAEKLRLEYITHFSYPSMSLVDAIMHSCSTDSKFLSASFLTLETLMVPFDFSSDSVLALLPDYNQILLAADELSFLTINAKESLRSVADNVQVVLIPFETTLSPKELFEKGMEFD